jgi:hypothetical protein
MALALIAGVPPVLEAQGRSAAIGVELGYTRASFSGRDAGGVTLHEGAVAGAYFQVRLASWLSIRPGIQIASKGGATTVVPSDSTNPVRFDLDLVYLDLPVLLRSRIPAIGRIRLILTGGVVPSVRIGCNVELTNGGTTLARSGCGQASVGIFRIGDVELLGGLGFGIPIENSELAVEARLTQGLRSVSDIGDIKNRALTFLISVPF